MPEVVHALCGAKSRDEQADALAQIWNSPLCKLAQICFEFTEGHLDRIEIWRVLGQIAERCTCSFDRLFHTKHLMGREIVHDDDVVAFERWSQELLDISHEYFSIHRPVEHERRHHSIVTQARHKGYRLPMSLRHMADQSLATRATPSEPHHIGSGRGLVEKHQPRRVKQALLSDPLSARQSDVGSVSLRRPQTFF